MSKATVMLLVVVVLAVWLLRRDRRTTVEQFASGPDSIFVSIPSYRDTACIATLKNMFDNATHPTRVIAGLCVQTTGTGAESCLPRGFKHHANVRIIKIPHTEAQGPTHARKLIGDLYLDETWFLGIDSHTRFSKGWDVELVRQIRELPPDSVLSHYPPAWDYKDTESVPIICKVKFDENGAPAHVATRLPAGTHYRTPYIGCNFVFGPGPIAALYESISHLWIPEEFFLSAKLFTHGYDVYTPSKNVLSHFYERKGQVRWHDDIKNWWDFQGPALARTMARLDPDNATFGPKRTLREFYDFCGIDMRQKKLLPSAERFCTQK